MFFYHVFASDVFLLHFYAQSLPTSRQSLSATGWVFLIILAKSGIYGVTLTMTSGSSLMVMKRDFRQMEPLVEPFVSVVNRPESGIDFGLTVNGRYYFGPVNHSGLFATVGGGGVYTSIKFHEQGTHGLFVLHCGLGYKWERLLVEGRFRHYSNASLAHPNRSVNATIVSAGYTF